ncbi:hypothetical protein [Novosphingobium guangzhouense]|nr:hypothetical protein [Novosphingobium guangzhouense]
MTIIAILGTSHYFFLRKHAMSALTQLKRHLRPGQVYRRKDLARWSNAVDRHLRQLVDEGRLEKVSAGVYMTPRRTRFGAAPAKTEKLVETFLGDDRFLLVSPSAFNSLGVGTTQLHNEPVVYNRKRHGRFKLDGRMYDFRMRSGVPRRLSREVLLVDLLHNLDRLPEDKETVLPRALAKAGEMDRSLLARAVKDFGSARAERLLAHILQTA